MRQPSLELCQDRRANTATPLLKLGLEQVESVWPWRAGSTSGRANIVIPGLHST